MEKDYIVITVKKSNTFDLCLKTFEGTSNVLCTVINIVDVMLQCDGSLQ